MPKNTKITDVLIIGASASGLMCAIEAGKRGRKVIVLDHANKAGKKILMSGGGRCNFTNMDVTADNFISHNPHFCKSALSRYTQWDFISMVNDHNITYHERDLGKLFCDDSAKDILDMLLGECKKVNVNIHLNSQINEIKQTESGFITKIENKQFQSSSLVVASGGLSIPKMCASPLGYKIAEQFNHHIWPTSAGLVPLTLQNHDKEKFESLSGISVESNVSNKRAAFNKENILFTHRGFSGPAILQISSYWQAGETIKINLVPEIDVKAFINKRQTKQSNTKLKNILSEILPKRLIPALFTEELIEKTLQRSEERRVGKECRL